MAKRKHKLMLFTADWCKQCPQFKSVLNEKLKEYREKSYELTHYDVGTSEGVEVASKYNIMSVPTLVVFPNYSKTPVIVLSANKIVPILDDIYTNDSLKNS